MLSMIPWDYNLAFGTFQGGDANGQVNFPIDTPVSSGMDDRPMVDWIFTDEDYTELYHKLFREFLSQTDFASIISETAELIKDYVEKDPTKFCTYEEFETGVAATTQFCTLRAESVSGQLDGSILSTSEGQTADSSSLIDTGALVLSEMGSMNNGGNFGGNGKVFNSDNSSQNASNETSEKLSNTNFSSMNGNRPDGFPQDGEGNSQQSPPNNSDTATSGGEFPDSQTSAPAKPDSEDNSRNPSDNQNEGFTLPTANSAPQSNQPMQQSAEDNPLLLLIISAAVLVGVLLTAALFKR